MFSGVVATNKHAWAPSMDWDQSTCDPEENQSLDDNDDLFGAFNDSAHYSQTKQTDTTPTKRR